MVKGPRYHLEGRVAAILHEAMVLDLREFVKLSNTLVVNYGKVEVKSLSHV